MNNRKTLSILVKPSSSLCNLHCRYCFYLDESKNRLVPSHGIMKEETMNRLIERIVEFLEGKGVANISFQGGEPLVCGPGYFRRFIARMKEYPDIETHYSIQTNGTLITDEIAELFHENKFLVGVSLDGYEENMNYFRLGKDGTNVYHKVLEGIELLRKHEVDFNILTVITRELARHPKALFDSYLENGFEYVQLIPCLPALENEDDGMSLTPELFASFYKSFFKTWKKNYERGRYLNVNLFENLMGMLKGYPPYQCGMIGRCTIQYVVEANGDVYPCDFYCLDEFRMGNVLTDTIEDLQASEGAMKMLTNSFCEKTPCRTCRFRNICYGGCQRQNVCYLNEEYCGYKDALETIAPQLYELVR